MKDHEINPGNFFVDTAEGFEVNHALSRAITNNVHGVTAISFEMSLNKMVYRR